jgi:hypothetical protein
MLNQNKVGMEIRKSILSNEATGSINNIYAELFKLADRKIFQNFANIFQRTINIKHAAHLYLIQNIYS